MNDRLNLAGLDEPTRERIFEGVERIGTARLDAFTCAMAHETAINAHKGDPDEQAALDHTREILYHAMKLYMAVLYGHREAALEYAADCGNHAWMAASAAGVLDLDLLTPGMEGETSGLYDSAGAGTPADLERGLADGPWRVSAGSGGFYEALKGLATKTAGELRHLPAVEREVIDAEHYWPVPSESAALGHRPRRRESGSG